LLESEKEFPTMATVLAGLAQKTGLKEVLIQTDSSETNTKLAAAWTDMLRMNTSIKILDLTTTEQWKGDSDSNLSAAVAEGLVSNSSLETVRLPHANNRSPVDSLFNGLVWQEMLESNHSLKKLSFSVCFITMEGFDCLARGLSCNTSLEALDLSNTDMGDPSVIALVDGLRINKTLKALDLSNNSRLSQSGRAAIEQLLGYNALRELVLADTNASVGASILGSGLSDSHSLEKLNLEGTFLEREGPETFRTLCESLRGITTLRFLSVRDNGVRLDSACAEALKLDTMSSETLDLDYNNVTSCGIAALAQSLRGPCTLKELSLMECQLDNTGLLKLGEALTTNDALEVLNVRDNDITHTGASQFCDMLPQMKGLKAVYGLITDLSDAPTDAVGLALVHGLQKIRSYKTSLKTRTILSMSGLLNATVLLVSHGKSIFISD
jgi:Ran GTPase-activating protein (RanGAP) involved in mRNA processing and transport